MENAGLIHVPHPSAPLRENQGHETNDPAGHGSAPHNLIRKNSNRKYMSPLDTLIEIKEDINPQVLTLPALDLDRLLEYKLVPESFNRGLHKNSSSGGHDAVSYTHLTLPTILRV